VTEENILVFGLRAIHKEIDGIECKKCSRCKNWQPISEFYTLVGNKDMLHSQCRQCCREQIWHSPHGRYVAYRNRAKQDNRKFKLSEEEFHQITSHNCFFCGMPHEKMGIDRLDSSKGYIAENCVPCCKYCNYMKRERSTLEFIRHCIKIAAYVKEDI